MPYRYYTPYYSPFNSYTPINDIHVTNAALVFFDRHGKMVSDLSLKFPDIKLVSKEQVSDFVSIKDTTVMICKDKKDIIAKFSDNNGDHSREEKITPALKDVSETIRSETQDNSGIRRWYGNFFYVYGYHVLRNASDKNTRDVFYINKIKIE
ncbi:MAG: hypothetical protein QM734_08785 [Cyclobacteriaceae bacterium]